MRRPSIIERGGRGAQRVGGTDFGREDTHHSNSVGALVKKWA